jgi:hypothetical protein
MMTVWKYVRFLLEPVTYLLFQIVILIGWVLVAFKGPVAAIHSAFVVDAHQLAAVICVLTPILSLLINSEPRPSIVAYILPASFALTVMLLERHVDPILVHALLLTYLPSAMPLAAWYYLNTRAPPQHRNNANRPQP